MTTQRESEGASSDILVQALTRVGQFDVTSALLAILLLAYSELIPTGLAAGLMLLRIVAWVVHITVLLRPARHWQRRGMRQSWRSRSANRQPARLRLRRRQRW